MCAIGCLVVWSRLNGGLEWRSQGLDLLLYYSSYYSVISNRINCPACVLCLVIEVQAVLVWSKSIEPSCFTGWSPCCVFVNSFATKIRVKTPRKSPSKTRIDPSFVKSDCSLSSEWERLILDCNISSTEVSQQPLGLRRSWYCDNFASSYNVASSYTYNVDADDPFLFYIRCCFWSNSVAHRIHQRCEDDIYS